MSHTAKSPLIPCQRQSRSDLMFKMPGFSTRNLPKLEEEKGLGEGERANK